MVQVWKDLSSKIWKYLNGPVHQRPQKVTNKTFLNGMSNTPSPYSFWEAVEHPVLNLAYCCLSRLALKNLKVNLCSPQIPILLPKGAASKLVLQSYNLFIPGRDTWCLCKCGLQPRKLCCAKESTMDQSMKPIFYKGHYYNLGVVAHSWNPSTQEIEAGWLQVWEQYGLYSKSCVNQCYIMKLCLKKTEKPLSSVDRGNYWPMTFFLIEI